MLDRDLKIPFSPHLRRLREQHGQQAALQQWSDDLLEQQLQLHRQTEELERRQVELNQRELLLGEAVAAEIRDEARQERLAAWRRRLLIWTLGLILGWGALLWITFSIGRTWR